jgi:hypothetical protein
MFQAKASRQELVSKGPSLKTSNLIVCQGSEQKTLAAVCSFLFRTLGSKKP